MRHTNWVYILASRRNGTLYVGSSSDLLMRLEEHRSGKGSRFVQRYNVFNLVYFEAHPSFEDALHREHQLKRWKRVWKLELIETLNPRWNDLTEQARDEISKEW